MGGATLSRLSLSQLQDTAGGVVAMARPLTPAGLVKARPETCTSRERSPGVLQRTKAIVVARSTAPRMCLDVMIAVARSKCEAPSYHSSDLLASNMETRIFRG